MFGLLNSFHMEVKVTLIKHVLSSMLVFVLSVLNPRKVVLKRINNIFSKFYWGGYNRDNPIKGPSGLRLISLMNKGV